MVRSFLFFLLSVVFFHILLVFTFFYLVIIDLGKVRRSPVIGNDMGEITD